MDTEFQNPHKNKVHKILAHLYTIQFVLFLLGVCLDFFFQFRIFTTPIIMYTGLLLLMIGTVLIIWAQTVSRDFKKDIMDGQVKEETFHKGPYHYTRSPTHLGLFLLMIGFGIVANAIFVIVFTCISFIVTKFTVLDKEEKILEEKYGEPYTEYKKSVKF